MKMDQVIPLSGSKGALVAHTRLDEGLLPGAEDQQQQTGLFYHLDRVAESTCLKQRRWLLSRSSFTAPTSTGSLGQDVGCGKALDFIAAVGSGRSASSRAGLAG